MEKAGGRSLGLARIGAGSWVGLTGNGKQLDAHRPVRQCIIIYDKRGRMIAAIKALHKGLERLNRSVRKPDKPLRDRIATPFAIAICGTSRKPCQQCLDIMLPQADVVIRELGLSEQQEEPA